METSHVTTVTRSDWLQVTAAQLAEFISQVREQSVTIPANTRSLLKKYFLASRRLRENFPQSALETLLR